MRSHLIAEDEVNVGPAYNLRQYTHEVFAVSARPFLGVPEHALMDAKIEADNIHLGTVVQASFHHVLSSMGVRFFGLSAVRLRKIRHLRAEKHCSLKRTRG